MVRTKEGMRKSSKEQANLKSCSEVAALSFYRLIVMMCVIGTSCDCTSPWARILLPLLNVITIHFGILCFYNMSVR